jgi:hypothetical protein
MQILEKTRGWLLPLASVLILSACGGGGGGSDGGTAGGNGASAAASGATLTAVTESNHASVSANAYAGSSSLLQAQSESGGLLTGAEIADSAFNAPRTVIDLLTLGVDGAAPLASGASQSRKCPGGGTLQYDASLQNSSRLSSGDSITLAATRCVENGATLDGTLTITVQDAGSGSLSGGAYAIKLSTRFAAFSANSPMGSISIDGDMQLAIQRDANGGQSVAMSGNALSITDGRNGKTVQRTLSAYSGTTVHNGLGTSSTLDGRLSGHSDAAGDFNVGLKTLQPFVSSGVGGYPTSGSLLVSGAASSVTLTVVDTTNVKLDYSAKGDGAVTRSSTIAWTELNRAI